jgi:hypothetical protein
MTPPEKNVVRRVGKPTLYERGCHRPIFPHHWLNNNQAAVGNAGVDRLLLEDEIVVFDKLGYRVANFPNEPFNAR